jgi:hypothetical protein
MEGFVKRLFVILACASLMAAAPSPSPSPAPSPAPVPKTAPTPPAPKDDDNRVGISGVWEVALQTTDGVVYTHFKLTQNGTALTGQYLDANGKKFPLAGTIDDKKVRLVVSMPDGTALIFSGSQEGNTDMVGTLTNAKTMVGFTAAYRPKYKWIDNIAPGAGTMGGNGVP